jgi:hypothetical protein
LQRGADAPGNGRKIGWIGMNGIGRSNAVPAHEKIVAGPARQDVHVNVRHGLTGRFTIGLHQVQSART